LLFYKKLRKDMESIGFVVNPYDPCVANMMVEGKQLTITWHVDDLKASHVNPGLIKSFINWIMFMYEDVTKVKASRGKKHDYLGIEIDYSIDGKVIFNMKTYVEKMMKEFLNGNQLKEGVKSSAADYLFKIN